MKVLVCDDLADRSREVIAAIRDAGQPNVDVHVIVGEKLTEELQGLFKRVDRCLNDPQAYKVADDLEFDRADIVVLDNNLAQLGINGARLTAEAIAGYIRAFSMATYIISLNKNPDVDFDLRYLVGDYETRADLALNTEHLANAALWSGNPGDARGGFSPWYWPKLVAAADNRRQQIAFIQKHLRQSVFDTFGFPTDEAVGFLSRHARGALSPNAEGDGSSRQDGVPIGEVTFRDVFTAKSRSLPAKDEREKLMVAATAGSEDVIGIIARVVAADIDFWFRRDVVGPQEMLVDAPHLLMRMPFLLGDRVRDLDQWNRVITEATPPFAFEAQLFESHLAKAKFEHDVWVRSPTFWWPKIKDDAELSELFFESKQGDWLDAVFCEDRAAFVERSPEKETPVEFTAEFEGSWTRRYVAKIRDIHYAPRSRFAV